jgi:hypothetical protein
MRTGQLDIEYRPRFTSIVMLANASIQNTMTL